MCRPAGVSEGIYLVGTGSTGAGSAFLTLGVGYGCAMAVGAWNMRVPREGWLPQGYTPPTEEEQALGDMT